MQTEIDTLFEEGVSLYEQGKMDEAESKLLRALELDSTLDEVKYNLALVYLEKKEYSKTNYLISDIRDINCDEIIDELEKVEFEGGQENPIETESAIDQHINYFAAILDEEYLPESINCEFCEVELKLSALERQNKSYICPKCKKQSNLREKERELENEFRNKTDVELYEILIEFVNFRLEFFLATKREIKRRNIQLIDNKDFLSVLEKYI